jgi:hypothetical protein
MTSFQLEFTENIAGVLLTLYKNVLGFWLLATFGDQGWRAQLILQHIQRDYGRQMTAAKSLAIPCQTLWNRLKTFGR